MRLLFTVHQFTIISIHIIIAEIFIIRGRTRTQSKIGRIISFCPTFLNLLFNFTIFSCLRFWLFLFRSLSFLKYSFLLLFLKEIFPHFKLFLKISQINIFSALFLVMSFKSFIIIFNFSLRRCSKRAFLDRSLNPIQLIPIQIIIFQLLLLFLFHSF